MRPAVEIEDYAYQYPGRKEWALSRVSLSIAPGECICFTGPSGCGKSTLFLAIKGLLKNGQEEGAIRFGNGHRFSGIVFQNAESQLLCTTVADEVAFGPQNMGLPPSEIKAAVDRSLKTVSLNGLENRNVEALSAGQAHRLAIASVLSTSPEILLLDEPTAQLDAPGKHQLKALLSAMKSSGRTLLIADHELGPFEALADRFVFMDRGRIMRIDGELPDGFTLSRPGEFSKPYKTLGATARPLLSVKGLSLSDGDGKALFDNLDLRLLPGQLIFIHGQNGAGKSTLLKCMTGLIRPDAGNISLAGLGPSAVDQLLGKIGLLFQNPERQLFEDTVWDEVAFSLKRMGLSVEDIKARVVEALETFEVSHLKDHSPLTLSFGEQHRVALASVMAPRPDILMLDEPFAGLDFVRRRYILKILSHLRRTLGTTVVIASHEFLPDETWADETLVMKEGRIEKLEKK